MISRKKLDEWYDEAKEKHIKIKKANKEFLDEYYSRKELSNCCGSTVVNGVCQDCGEHCEES